MYGKNGSQGDDSGVQFCSLSLFFTWFCGSRRLLCGLAVSKVTCTLLFYAKMMCGFLLFGFVLQFSSFENTQINANTLPVSFRKSNNVFLRQNHEIEVS